MAVECRKDRQDHHAAITWPLTNSCFRRHPPGRNAKPPSSADALMEGSVGGCLFTARAAAVDLVWPRGVAPAEAPSCVAPLGVARLPPRSMLMPVRVTALYSDECGGRMPEFPSQWSRLSAAD